MEELRGVDRWCWRSLPVLSLDCHMWQPSTFEDISLAQALVDGLAAGCVCLLLSLLQVADDGMRVLYHLAVTYAAP